MEEQDQPRDALLSSVKRACARLDVGKTTLFKLIHKGRLTTVKIGSRTLITEASIRKLAAGPARCGGAPEVDAS